MPLALGFISELIMAFLSRAVWWCQCLRVCV